MYKNYFKKYFQKWLKGTFKKIWAFNDFIIAWLL